MEKENSKSKGLTLGNNPLLITVCTVVAILLVISGIFLSVTLMNDGENDVPQYIEGIYSMDSLGMGSSLYTFRGDGSGNLTYATDSTPTSRDFKYEINGEGGSRSISFTWSDTGEVTTHEYSTGKKGDAEFIMINQVFYYKQ